MWHSCIDSFTKYQEIQVSAVNFVTIYTHTLILKKKKIFLLLSLKWTFNLVTRVLNSETFTSILIFIEYLIKGQIKRLNKLLLTCTSCRNNFNGIRPPILNVDCNNLCYELCLTRIDNSLDYISWNNSTFESRPSSWND